MLNNINESSPVVKMLEEQKPEKRNKHIHVLYIYSKNFGLGKDMKGKRSEEIYDDIFDLDKSLNIIPIPGFTKNYNLETAKKMTILKVPNKIIFPLF